MEGESKWGPSTQQHAKNGRSIISLCDAYSFLKTLPYTQSHVSFVDIFFAIEFQPHYPGLFPFSTPNIVKPPILSPFFLPLFCGSFILSMIPFYRLVIVLLGLFSIDFQVSLPIQLVQVSRCSNTRRIYIYTHLLILLS